MKNDQNSVWIVAWFVAAHNKPLLILYNAAALLASIIIPPKPLFFPQFWVWETFEPALPTIQTFKLVKVQTVVYFLMPLIWTSSSFLKHATQSMQLFTKYERMMTRFHISTVKSIPQKLEKLMTYQKAFAEAVKEIRKLIDDDTEAHTKIDSILKDLKITRLMIWNISRIKLWNILCND